MIVARVNEYYIHNNEYQAELKKVLLKLKIEVPTMDAKMRAIEQLVDGYLLLTQARKTKNQISSDEIDSRFIDYSLNFDSQEDFLQDLDNYNMNMEEFREKIRDELCIKQYVNEEFSPQMDICNRDLKEIYEENIDSFVTPEAVKASHILIKGTDEASRLKAQKIRDSINSPGDFTREARNCSDCPSNCNCGDLGYVTRGKMIREFEDIIFDLGVNEISQPVKTQFGYHIVMVTEKKEKKTASFEKIKDALSSRLQKIDCELRLIKHLKELRLQADIEIFRDKL
jgi:peptidyl-prolyl cis-trans isomerase C